MQRGFLLPKCKDSADKKIQSAEATMDMKTGNVETDGSDFFKVMRIQESDDDFKMTQVTSKIPGGSFNVILKDGKICFNSKATSTMDHETTPVSK